MLDLIERHAAISEQKEMKIDTRSERHGVLSLNSSELRFTLKY